MRLKALSVASVLAGVALGGAAHATVITSSAGLTEIPFQTVNAFGPGPEVVSPNITWTSTNATTQGGSVYGYDEGYGFDSNGYSNATLVGLNDSSDGYPGTYDHMTFSFTTPVSAVGAVLNWVPNASPVIIEALSANGSVIDALLLSAGDSNLVAPDSFYGFKESTPDIYGFQLDNGYVAALGGLYTPLSAVPEPSVWALMIAGIGMIGGMLRLGRRRTAGGLATA